MGVSTGAGSVVTGVHAASQGAPQAIQGRALACGPIALGNKTDEARNGPAHAEKQGFALHDGRYFYDVIGWASRAETNAQGSGRGPLRSPAEFLRD